MAFSPQGKGGKYLAAEAGCQKCTPGSETRDERIAEYHVVNANPVVGLEEGALVRVENGAVTARGTARVKIFRRGQAPTWHEAGERLALDA